MASGRHELNEIKQEDEQKDFLIPVSLITIQPVSQAIALDLRLSRREAKKDQIKAKALGVALTDRYGVGDAASLASVCKNINRLFQPSLLAAKVYHAAPLTEIENDIRKALAKDPTILSRKFYLGVASGTLSQLAVIGLDQTIRNNQGVVVAEGMVERILKLYYELSPATYEQALEKIRLAAPLEDKEAQNTRESDNYQAVNKVFDAIKKNDANTAGAIANFKAWVKNQKPREMTDNSYHLNLIHLIYCGFDILASQGGTLEGGWYGALGDQFCFEVIGDTIESELPFRIQQILRSSLYHLLHSNRAAPRDVDNSAIFKSRIFKSHTPSGPDTKLLLGVNSYYDDHGLGRVGDRQRADHFFQNLLQQLHQSLRITLCPGQQPKTLCINKNNLCVFL